MSTIARTLARRRVRYGMTVAIADRRQRLIATGTFIAWTRKGIQVITSEGWTTIGAAHIGAVRIHTKETPS